MNLQDALKLSEFRKATATLGGMETTVEANSHGYQVAYSGKSRHYTTIEALLVFLGPEAAQAADWRPVQA